MDVVFFKVSEIVCNEGLFIKNSSSVRTVLVYSHTKVISIQANDIVAYRFILLLSTFQ